MIPSEFKAWFEGFTESMDGPPSLKQWERIQARVKQITGTPTSYPVFVDRYRPMWLDNHFYTGSPLPQVGTVTCLSAQGVNGNVGNVAFETTRIGGTGLGPNGYMARLDAKGSGPDGGTVFDSHSAMNALGKADAASLAA